MNEQELVQALEQRVAGVDPAGAPVASMIGRAAVTRRRRTATAVAAAAAVAVVAVTASVIDLGGERAAPEVVSPGEGEGSGTLARALAVLPDDTATVAFHDRAAAAERLGLASSGPEEYADAVAEYLATAEGAADPGGLVTPLTPFLTAMADLAFNDLEVQWAVVGSSSLPDGIDAADGVTVYQVSPATDLDAVADDLVAAGFTEDDLRGRRHLVADDPVAVTDATGLVAGGYPPDFVDVTVDTEADLLIVGAGSRAVLQVLDDQQPSLADAGTFAAVVGASADAEVADLRIGSACLGDPAGLQRPDAEGFLWGPGAGGVTARLVFPDAATAAADLEARTTHLETGAFGEDALPLSGYGDYDVGQAGEVVEIVLDVPSDAVADLAYPVGIFGC
jgi:hypothetical protein